VKKVPNIIAMCGLVCNDCIAYVATQKNDDKLREKAIEAWSTETERLKLEDINCDGCQIGKRLYKFCSACEVRKSGLERDMQNCAYCNEYPCKKLEKLWRGFRTVSWKEAKATLDNLRKIEKLA
jgi:hypothetical protein